MRAEPDDTQHRGREELPDMRVDYTLADLDEASVPTDPLLLFERWFAEIRDHGTTEPNAMVLSTVAPDGRPSSRAVLLKGLSADGFVLFTNYDSRKGRDLAATPACALHFGWYELQRQVRVEGSAHRLPRAQTEVYFATRPRDSQIGAWASPQSQVVGSRDELDAAFTARRAEFGDAAVPPPPHWGGFVVVPEQIEFWQGRHGRMHDRVRYRREDPTRPGWTVERLAP